MGCTLFTATCAIVETTKLNELENLADFSYATVDLIIWTALTHFVTALSEAKASWKTGDDLDRLLDKFSGDIVQAVQALKETKPEETITIIALQKLLAGLNDCAGYCSSTSPSPLRYPFTRAERQVRDLLAVLDPNGGLYSQSQKGLIHVDVSKRESRIEMLQLGPHQVPRLFNGLWQLSSPAWGSGSAEGQEKALTQIVEAGLSATDMADHYGDAELIYGDFRNRLPTEIRSTVCAATKWCIFGPIGQPVTTEFVLRGVKERCRRLGGRVELLQFHWHDYSQKDYLDILVELVHITKTHPELVSTIGLCNFDTEHTEESCEYVLEKTGVVGIVSNQVQFSLLDARPLQKMCAVCEKYGIKLLTYGSFCGGFVSEKWLGQPTPEIYSEVSQLTPSQRKYFDMIETWGTWAEFQLLLSKLSSIAQKHGPDISLTNVATRWVLQQPAVGAVIVGTRLGVSSHVEDNLNVFNFKLDEEDVATINETALGGLKMARAEVVYEKLGDCGNEYRAMH
ncbi:hypothetical protein VMCG_09859 [Cytospora schulzeri]|uniref:NADP-dependent oxidoreductase domain-containing protein n=1 Tax=Cytospora schulzeri TaxID=448051 RepID=A0A423VDM2_9PEZI|nr:hypothetical protein VMCG_09859 [Valsa malicola]